MPSPLDDLNAVAALDPEAGRLATDALRKRAGVDEVTLAFQEHERGALTPEQLMRAVALDESAREVEERRIAPEGPAAQFAVGLANLPVRAGAFLGVPGAREGAETLDVIREEVGGPLGLISPFGAGTIVTDLATGRLLARAGIGVSRALGKKWLSSRVSTAAFAGTVGFVAGEGDAVNRSISAALWAFGGSLDAAALLKKQATREVAKSYYMELPVVAGRREIPPQVLADEAVLASTTVPRVLSEAQEVAGDLLGQIKEMEAMGLGLTPDTPVQALDTISQTSASLAAHRAAMDGIPEATRYRLTPDEVRAQSASLRAATAEVRAFVEKVFDAPDLDLVNRADGVLTRVNALREGGLASDDTLTEVFNDLFIARQAFDTTTDDGARNLLAQEVRDLGKRLNVAVVDMALRAPDPALSTPIVNALISEPTTASVEVLRDVFELAFRRHRAFSPRLERMAGPEEALRAFGGGGGAPEDILHAIRSLDSFLAEEGGKRPFSPARQKFLEEMGEEAVRRVIARMMMTDRVEMAQTASVLWARWREMPSATTGGDLFAFIREVLLGRALSKGKTQVPHADSLREAVVAARNVRTGELLERAADAASLENAADFLDGVAPENAEEAMRLLEERIDGLRDPTTAARLKGLLKVLRSGE